MASYFNADYYFAAKAKQLSNIPGGKTYTAAEVKAEFAQLGVNPEEHYKAFGSAEGLNPNPYFNEKEYLETKLKSLQENAATKAEWTGKSAADLKATFSAAGLSAAEHYEKAGAFETRADGTLLNPSNAFDANAYFAAKLAQLQKAGFDGADTMTVADVVKAVQSAGISPVSHLQTAGAAEAKADGIALVQTVPVAQRMPNDTNRAATGELVPGNYNQPTKGPAAATAAPVTKPADVGGLSADAPVAPTEAVKTPADTGFVAPPAGLVDGPNSVVIPPSGHTGTGPNASFVVVDKTTGKGDVIKLDGTKQGTIDKVEFDSTGNPVKPPVDVIIKDESGKNTNDKPVDDNDEPVPPQPDPDEPVDPVDPVDPVTPLAASVSADAKTLTLTGTETVGQVMIAPKTDGALQAKKGAAGLGFDDLNPITATTTKAVVNIDASAVSNTPVFMMLEDYKTDESAKFGSLKGGSGNDYINVTSDQLTVTGEAAGITKINGGAGSDTLEINILSEKVTNGTGFFRAFDKTSGGGNGDNGKLYSFDPVDCKKLLGHGATAGTAVTNVEILRLYSDLANWGDYTSKSNATIWVDSASVADTFTEFHFAENARVFGLTATEKVKDVSANLQTHMALDSSTNTANSAVVNLVTEMKKYDNFTTIGKVVAYTEGQAGMDDTSAFKTLNISGNGNVVFDNSESAVGVNVNATMNYVDANKEGETQYHSGTLLFKGADGPTLTGDITADTTKAKADTVTVSGTGHFKIDTGKGADTVNLSGSVGGESIVWLDWADYFPNTDRVGSSVTAATGASGGVADFTAIDTISGFKVGAGGHKLGVGSFLGKWTNDSARTWTEPTLEDTESSMGWTGDSPSSIETLSNATADTVAKDNKIYVIKNADFAISTQEAAFKFLFGDGSTGGYLKNDDYSAPSETNHGIENVVIVQGTTDTYVFYIDNDADGNNTAFVQNEVALVATLKGVNHASGDFTAENFW